MQAAFPSFFRSFTASDFFVDLPFWAELAVIVVVYRLLPPQRAAKEVALLACSIGMLLVLPRFDLKALAMFVALCAGTYGCGRLLNGGQTFQSPRARRALATAGVLLIVFVLAFFKYTFVQRLFLPGKSFPASAGTQVFFLMGISYSSFKAMHFVIESYKKSIKEWSFLTFLNYMLFFPSFMSGPINRYNHFCQHSALARNSPLAEDLRGGLERIIHGLFKKTVLTVILLPWTLPQLRTPLAEMSWSQVVLGLYAYALYFYLDFSGYTDLAIGTARLLGFGLPENFNYPFLKKNIQQLWVNWHISLTSWLTDYLYWPLVRRGWTYKCLQQRPALLSYLAIVVTFLVCGAWHGNTLSFLFWGLYHGLGIVTVNQYQRWKRQTRSARLRRYFASGFSRGWGAVLTFNYYAAGLVLFTLEWPQVKVLLRHLL